MDSLGVELSRQREQSMQKFRVEGKQGPDQVG